MKDRVRGRVVLVDRDVPAPVNLNPSPARRSDERVREQFDPDRPAPARPGGPPAQTPPPMSAVEISRRLDEFLVANGALARANDRAARSAGLKPEKHGFRPHVTLARLRGTRPEAVARALEALGGFESAPFQVSRFVLFSSRPKVGGGPYVVEDAFDLRGAEYVDAR